MTEDRSERDRSGRRSRAVARSSSVLSRSRPDGPVDRTVDRSSRPNFYGFAGCLACCFYSFSHFYLLISGFLRFSLLSRLRPLGFSLSPHSCGLAFLSPFLLSGFASGLFCLRPLRHFLLLLSHVVRVSATADCRISVTLSLSGLCCVGVSQPAGQRPHGVTTHTSDKGMKIVFFI